MGAFPVVRWMTCALVVAATAAMAQATHGTVAGTVTDPTGATLAGVEVTLTSIERGFSVTVTTGKRGMFEEDRLLPGAYAIRAEHAGFKAGVVDRVDVRVGARTRADLRLELGARGETVEVRPEGQLLETGRGDVATAFGEREIRDLPNLDRNLTRMLLLVPGAQLQHWQHAPSENPQGSLQVQVVGQGFHGTGYLLDGVDNREPVLGIAVINPTLESIAQARVVTQNFDASYGQAVAGVVSVQTKSGTNDVHGSLFEFHQGDRFQARNPFTQPPDQPLPETTRHLFGGSIGGPIRRDRLFFFADYQGLRSTVGGSRLLTVPTERARRGDLSEYGVAIYDPLTGGPENRDLFDGAVIPAHRLSPQIQNLLRLLPLPNRPGVQDNYLASGSEQFDGDAFNVRLDAVLDDGVKLFARYSVADYDRSGPPSLGLAGGPELVSQAGVSASTNHSGVLGLDWALDENTLLDARFGFYRYGVDIRQFDYGTTPATDAGMPGLNLAEDSSGLPVFWITGAYGFTFGSGGCNCPLRQDEKQGQLVASLTRAVGRHTLQVGADVRRADNLRVPSDAHRSGEIYFFEDRTRGPEGGGLALASFLLGDVGNFSRFASRNTNARERQWREYYWLQDTWRVRPRLTVNLGLRLENVHPQTVNEPGNGGWLDLDTGDILVAGVGDVPMNGGQRGRLHWAPRLSATWELGERTVLRAAAGRSYDIGVFGTTFSSVVTQNPPVLVFQQLNAPQSWESVFNVKDGPPAPVFPVPGADGRLRLPDQVFALALPDEILLPAIDAWNLGVQRQFGDHLTADVAYVGNRGRRTHQGGIGINDPTLTGFPDVPPDERRPYYAGPVGGIGAPYGWSQSVRYYCGCGDSSYDALQARLARRFADGWSLQAHWTLQRVRDDGGAQYWFEPGLDVGRPSWDRVSSAVLAGIAEIPVGRGRRFLADASPGWDRVLGGWQVSAVAFVQSGRPFDVSYRGAGADRDVRPNRPDLVGDVRPGSGNGIDEPWFNATPIGSPGSAFARPAVGTFGDLERNRFSGPGYWRVDASLFKRLDLGRTALELRLDVVNVFNHVNLGQPDDVVGIPGNENPRAGFISSTAQGNADPQRNVQLGVRLAF